MNNIEASRRVCHWLANISNDTVMVVRSTMTHATIVPTNGLSCCRHDVYLCSAVGVEKVVNEINYRVYMEMTLVTRK